MSLFCPSHNSVHPLHFRPSWDRSKLNKQGCGTARKVHGNGVIDEKKKKTTYTSKARHLNRNDGTERSNSGLNFPFLYFAMLSLK